MNGFSKTIIERYLARTKKSKELYEIGRMVMPDGGGGDMQCYYPYPVYMEHADGTRLYDVDSNEYIDFFSGAGTVLLGHCSPIILNAVKEAIEKGIPSSVAYENEVEYAKKLRKHMPSMEMIRFLPSGAAANEAGIRVSRRFTGRNKIAKFEGGYHGQASETLISLEPVGDSCGPEAEPSRILWHTVMPKEALDSVIVLPFNNIEATVSLIEKNADTLAVVLAEPALVHGGAVAADKDYLIALREVTKKHGILLLFDEVITAFRLGLGGAQEIYCITPDLTVLGKPVGGGYPMGVLGGRSDVMDVISMEKQSDKVCVAGSHSGHSVAVAAGLAMIKELEKGEYHKHVHELGRMAAVGLRQVFSDAGVACQITGDVLGIWAGFWVHFTDHPVRSARDTFKGDLMKLMEFYIGQISRGIFMPPTGCPSISGAHTREDINKMLETSASVLKDMKNR